jgi:hypothetical protein
MFEDILGHDKKFSLKELIKNMLEENTIIVCPTCGTQMMSVTINDDEPYRMIDCEFKCRQCTDDPLEILKYFDDNTDNTI